MRLLVVAFLCLTFSVWAHAEDRVLAERQATRITHSVRRDIERDGLDAVAVHTDRALDALVARATRKLVEHGDGEYASQKQSEWELNYSGYLTRMMRSRHIGDHPTEMLSTWLESFYDRVELVLGVELCKAFHLSDIKTINCCVKVCFKPCSFAMDGVTETREQEYQNHFAKDIGGVGELYGLVPVVTYWAIVIGCAAGGVSAPISMIAAPLGEFVMGKWIAPPLSNWIWERSCGLE